jgi:hypothetical protein
MICYHISWVCQKILFVYVMMSVLQESGASLSGDRVRRISHEI